MASEIVALCIFHELVSANSSPRLSLRVVSTRKATKAREMAGSWQNILLRDNRATSISHRDSVPCAGEMADRDALQTLTDRRSALRRTARTSLRRRTRLDLRLGAVERQGARMSSAKRAPGLTTIVQRPPGKEHQTALLTTRPPRVTSVASCH